LFLGIADALIGDPSIVDERIGAFTSSTYSFNTDSQPRRIQ
jgi:hypothetical protein